MRLTSCLWALPIVLASEIGSAQTKDSAASREQLQQGYALKQQGKCNEAIPHFAESVRLDRQPKSLLNLADCEEKTGQLVAAQAHLVEARDLAALQGMTPLKSIAEQHLQTVEKRMPRLVVKIAPGTLAHTTVLRDEVELGAVSIGIPLPLDPGPHTISARGGGYEHKYNVVLAEGVTQEIEVTPVGGTPVQTQAASGLPSAAASQGIRSDLPSSDASAPPASSSALSGRRTGALVLAGIGVVGIGVGTAMALSAKSTWKTASDACPANTCTDLQVQQDGNRARSTARLATVPIVGGLAAVAVGGVLWFTGSRQAPAAAWTVTPAIGSSSGALYLQGGF